MRRRHRPIGGSLWQIETPTAVLLLKGLSLAGFLTSSSARSSSIILICSYAPPEFTVRGWNGYVRHPIYLGCIIAFWATPTMTAAHFVFAVATTVYIVVAMAGR